MKHFLSIVVFLWLLAAGRPVAAQTWDVVSSLPVTPDWTCVACSASGSNLITACYPFLSDFDGVYVSNNRGATWVMTSLPTDPVTNRWTCVAASSDGIKLVAGCGSGSGAIFTSSNSGASWNQTAAPNDDYSCIASSPDGTKLVTGCDYSSSIYTSADSGETWRTNKVSEFTHGVAISASGSDMAAVSGYFSSNGNTNHGEIAYSEDAGATWHPSDAPINVIWNGIACSTNGNFMVAVAEAVTNAPDNDSGFAYSASLIYVSTNYGVNWKPVNAPQLFPWASVTCSADGKLITASAVDYYSDSGSGNATYSSDDFGVTWYPNETLNTNSAFYYGSDPLPTVSSICLCSSADGSKLAGVDGYVIINPPLTTGGGTKPPNLTIRFKAPASVVVSWPAGNYTLQSNAALSTTNWVANTNAVTTVNNTNSITITPPKGNLFFRLSNP